MSGIDADVTDFYQLFCSSAYDIDAVLDGVRSVIGGETELIGCVSTGEFTERTVAEQAVAVGVVSNDSLSFTTSIGTDISDNVIASVREALAGLPTESREYPYQAAIVLHDGLSGLIVTTVTIYRCDRTIAYGRPGTDLQ